MFELPLCTWLEPPDKSLPRYQAKMVSDNPRRQLITVQRSPNNIIRDVLKEYKRGSLDIQKVPDVEFIGEEGIDAKGLTREFSHIMMSCLRENFNKSKGYKNKLFILTFSLTSFKHRLTL